MSLPPSITCPKCQRTSYNLNDIAQGYCGHCRDWTSKVSGVLIGGICPSCSEPLTMAVPNTAKQPNRGPKSGECSMCLRCGELLVFLDDTGTNFRPAELNDLMKLSPKIHKAIDEARANIKAKKANQP